MRTGSVATAQKAALANVDGVQVYQVAEPAVREPRRNLFAFTEEPRPARAAVVRATEARIVEKPQVVVEQKSDDSTQRVPEFPMRFIGTFGLAKDPIAVFEGNGEVVNAKIGERVTGDFRLSSIGLESVEVSTAGGAAHKVPLARGRGGEGAAAP
ncbi:MAG TPA: hypothetical protein VHU41_05045 [Thermoanaerobaculia bacterium]|nr:hypothetical protein [Thermoanaerobaculia bacterium]